MSSRLTFFLIVASVCFGQTAPGQNGARTQTTIQGLRTTLRKAIEPGVVLRTRVELARLYQRQGDWWNALDQLEALRKLAPAEPEYAYQLGTVYNALSRSAFDRMQSRTPDSARTQQLMAEQFVVVGENNRAVKALQRAIKADPALEGSHLALAMIYMRMGRRPDAAAEIEQELAIAPQSAAAKLLRRELAGETK